MQTFDFFICLLLFPETSRDCNFMEFSIAFYSMGKSRLILDIRSIETLPIVSYYRFCNSLDKRDLMSRYQFLHADYLVPIKAVLY